MEVPYIWNANVLSGIQTIVVWLCGLKFSGPYHPYGEYTGE